MLGESQITYQAAVPAGVSKAIIALWESCKFGFFSNKGPKSRLLFSGWFTSRFWSDEDDDANGDMTFLGLMSGRPTLNIIVGEDQISRENRVSVWRREQVCSVRGRCHLMLWLARGLTPSWETNPDWRAHQTHALMSLFTQCLKGWRRLCATHMAWKGFWSFELVFHMPEMIHMIAQCSLFPTTSFSFQNVHSIRSQSSLCITVWKSFFCLRNSDNSTPLLQFAAIIWVQVHLKLCAGQS